jgi:hypothetical protein
MPTSTEDFHNIAKDVRALTDRYSNPSYWLAAAFVLTRQAFLHGAGAAAGGDVIQAQQHLEDALKKLGGV